MKNTLVKALHRYIKSKNGVLPVQMRGWNWLLVFCALISCAEQNKAPAQQAVKPNPAEQPATDISDIDPYFVNSQTIVSAYGPNSITRNIAQDKSGNLWLASWQGIIRYDGASFINMTLLAGLRRYHVFSVLVASNGDLWFGTIGAGAYRYDGNTFTNFTEKEGLVTPWVVSMVEDKSGNIWLGGNGGAFRYDGKGFTPFTTDNGLCDNAINAIAIDRNGMLWFGTQNGVCCYDGKGFHSVLTKEGKPFHNVRSIIEDKQGNIWIGGQDGLFCYDGKTCTAHATNFTGYILEDHSGNIWVSAGEPNTNNMFLGRLEAKYMPSGMATLTKIVSKESPDDFQVFGIFEDKAGNILFGTMNGVCRYDGKTEACFAE